MNSTALLTERLSLPLSPNNGLLIRLAFAARPASDHALTIFVDTSSAGSGATRRCEEPCLANSSAVSFPSIPHVFRHPDQLDRVMFCQLHQEMMTLPDHFGIHLQTEGWLTVGQNTAVCTCVALYRVSQEEGARLRECSLC